MFNMYTHALARMMIYIMGIVLTKWGNRDATTTTISLNDGRIQKQQVGQTVALYIFLSSYNDYTIKTRFWFRCTNAYKIYCDFTLRLYRRCSDALSLTCFLSTRPASLRPDRDVSHRLTNTIWTKCWPWGQWGSQHYTGLSAEPPPPPPRGMMPHVWGASEQRISVYPTECRWQTN